MPRGVITDPPGSRKVNLPEPIPEPSPSHRHGKAASMDRVIERRS